jgi:hypothetical protein
MPQAYRADVASPAAPTLASGPAILRPDATTPASLESATPTDRCPITSRQEFSPLSR